MTYHLTVRQVEQTCLFQLTWGRSLQLTAKLPYAPQLATLYHQWQQAYLNFYRYDGALRGRVGVAGQVVSPAVDRHSRLVEAEARFLSEFHRWLRHGNLYDICQELGKADGTDGATHRDILLTCDPILLARFPWETWELRAGGGHRRIARVSNLIRAEVPQIPRPRRGKARVLVVLGNDEGLDFAGDRQALQALKSLVDITFVGWQPGQDTRELKQEICGAIAAPPGWDILFFAGHSNESEVVDGSLSIAPHTALSIRELAPYLQTAQAHGLKFALFNSCSGLTIAEALVEMGLSQVAVMREPIHNDVAQRFLVPFLQALVQQQDVQDALVTACRHLKSEQSLTYPSAYLVPSLFRHPDAVPFRLERTDWRYQLQRWLPSRRQGVALAAVAILSVVPAVRETLLSGRLLTQAVYRNLTGQLPPATPPVVLIQIDDASIQRSPLLADPSPINLEYLALVVDQLRTHQASVVGIDYLLDRQRDNAAIFTQALQSSVEMNQTWFVFFSHWEDDEEIGPNAAMDITDLRWSMQAYTDAFKWYLALPWHADGCLKVSCPFSYQLALTALYQRAADAPQVQPDLSNAAKLRPALAADIAANPAHPPELQRLAQLKSPAITLNRLFLPQRWLHPIADFSVPPNRVIHRISAHQLLAGLDEKNADIIQAAPVVLIGAVGYSEAEGDGWEEIHAEPWATTYWRHQGQDTDTISSFSGVEFLAYGVHHFLNHHMLVPVPALWMVALSALLSQGITLMPMTTQTTRAQRVVILALGSGVYGVLVLQGALWFNLMVPWLLPTMTGWVYLLPHLWSNRYDRSI
ncbi:MAG: CHASE2 domain-containing protein [Cyanobacteria bacterium]|nr:CHASE2 domain-containing protein [Cyanobacteriota bacterium]MDA0865191.1 CHASE2 domain-containing protein [Cyanobacteriota bacterium]